MGLSFSSLSKKDEDQRVFICLSGQSIPENLRGSIPQTIRRAERLQSRSGHGSPCLVISLPRQEDAQHVDSGAIDLLAEILTKSSELLELSLICNDAVPAPLCRAIALNQSIRSLSLSTSYRDAPFSFTSYELPHDLMDAIGRNNTIESLLLRGDVNKMASSVARLLLGAPRHGLQNLALVHYPRIDDDFYHHIRYGAVDTKQMDLLVQAVGCSRSLKHFTLTSNGGKVHYSNHQLAAMLRSPSLESLSLSEMKLCGESSSNDRQVYAALSLNRRLRDLNLTSFTKFAQHREIAANLESQVESALRDLNTTLIKLKTLNTIRTKGHIQHWLDLNAAGRALIRNGEQVDTVLPHMLSRVSNDPNRLYGLLREATECLCNPHY